MNCARPNDQSKASYSRIILLTDGLNGQHGGIQRVSRSVLEAVKADNIPTFIWSANDRPLHSISSHVIIRCFEGDYLRMAISAVITKLPQNCIRVICLHGRLTPIAACLAIRLRCSLDIFINGVEMWGKLPLLVHYSLYRATSFCAISHYSLNRFQEDHPRFSCVPSKVLSLGLSSDFISSSDQYTETLHAKPYFLTVMRFTESYKGEKTLLEAFKKLQTIHGYQHISLNCVGDGVMRMHWEKYAQSLGLENVVRFLGAVSDAGLSQLYAECLGFIMLSEGEGFGLVFLEAMYHGKPCISTNVDASQELVRNEITGLTVSPRNVEAATRAICRLIDDIELRKRLGREGRKAVLDYYSPEHFAARLKKYLVV